MNHPLKYIVFFIVLMMSVPPVINAAKKNWKDEGELSYVETGGNTDTSTLSAKNTLNYKFNEKTNGTWKVGVLNSENAGVKSAESYFSELRGDYLMTKHLYAALVAGWSKDKFAGIDSRYYVGPTVGYKILNGPKQFLKSEASLDYVNEEYTNDTDADFTRGRLFGEYEYRFNEDNTFIQSLEFLQDFSDGDNYNVNSDSALISSLNEYFSLKTSYEIRHDNKPVPAILDKTDTTLRLSLLVSF